MPRDIAPDDPRHPPTPPSSPPAPQPRVTGRPSASVGRTFRSAAATFRSAEPTAPLAHPPPRPVDRAAWTVERDIDRPRHLSPRRPEHPPIPLGRRRQQVHSGGRIYRLRASELTTLRVAGMFRAVAVRDLAHYRTSTQRAQDLRSLTAQGLAEQRVLVAKSSSQPVSVITLTRDGRHLVEAHDIPRPLGASAQRFYDGWVKPREMNHDSALYRMYLIEAARIETEGGRVRRVLLDHELKQGLYAQLNLTAPPSPDQRATHLDALAAHWHLPVVDGHVQFPDLRIEYETRDGVESHRDLELVTDDYRAAQLAGKVRGGFTLYRLGGRHDSRGGQPYDPDHVTRLLA